MHYDAKSGFTLMEVLVALAVFAFGSLAVGRYLDSFNRLRSMERDQTKSLIAAVETMEYFIRNPPPCTDSSFVLNEVDVVRSTMPGVVSLAWVVVSTGGVGQVELRRLVWCKKI